MIVYLAGGMKSGWQDIVIGKLGQSVTFVDPRTHKQKAEKNYTSWDLFGINRADFVFAYLEADNPSGIGMTFEIGYAKARGITIIFVEETGHPLWEYFGMCRASADFYCISLDHGISILRSLL